MEVLPSGKRLHNQGKSSFLMGKLTISMAIFNSYVKLLEGMMGKSSLIDGGIFQRMFDYLKG